MRGELNMSTYTCTCIYMRGQLNMYIYSKLKPAIYMGLE